MPQYYGSTDPQTVPATTPQQTYSNFNGINSPAILSTGTITGAAIVSTGSITLTGTLTVTGDVSTIDAPEAVSGSTIGTTASAYDLDNVGVQSLTAGTSEITVKYWLQAPVAGAQKRIITGNIGTTQPQQIYASSSGGYTAYFGANTSNISLHATGKNIIIDLLGVSTAQWLVTSISTLNCATTGTVSIATSNT